MKDNRSILFVEDDAVVLTTYRNLLQREGFRVESAGDGLEALRALSQETPDLIVLDLMLPKFDGADVLKFIRADPRLKAIPIIIFSNALLKDYAEDAITKQLRKTDCTSAILLGTIQEMLQGTAAKAPDASNAVQSDSASAAKSDTAGNDSPGAQAGGATESKAKAGASSSTKERSEFLKESPAEITKLRELCLAYIKAPTSAAKLEPLARSVQSLSTNAEKAGCARIALLTKAFDMLLAKIAAKPARVTPSILQTLAEAADCLGILLKSDAAGPGEAAFRAKVLAVDDDTVCNHVIVTTLKRANLDITSVEDPFEGLKLLQANHYDLILLDIDMPKLTGFEVCEKLRSLPQYKTTPVIFVTAHSNFGNRTQGVLSGGNYFITKPVDPLELALKVTIHLFKAQAQHAGATLPEPKSTAKLEAKSKAASALEAAAPTPIPIPANPQTSSHGNANGKAKSDDSTSLAPPQVFIAPEAVLKSAPPAMKPTPPAAKLPPPALKSAPPIPINPSKNGNGKDAAPPPTLSAAPPIKPPSPAPPAKPRGANVSKILAPPSGAPNLGETGTLNVSKLSGSRNRNSIMNNQQDEAFEKIVVAVVRIIFGDDNLTEMNVRLVRIALERYNVHEVINSPVAA